MSDADNDAKASQQTGVRTRMFGVDSVRISEEVQVDANGKKASDYLTHEQIGDVGEGQTANIEAVREDRADRGAASPKHPAATPLNALGQPFATFRHTSEFTEEEDALIMNGLLAHLPVYLIAAKVHCSRGILSKHIKESKLLQSVWEDREESMLDHVEFQAKRLIDSGNPAMIMYWLDHKGKSRGWGEQDTTEVGEDESRIVIGEIPEDEVERAEREIAENGRQIGVGIDADGDTIIGTVGTGGESPKKVRSASDLPKPMEFALEQERLQKEQDEADLEAFGRTADGRTESDVDVVEGYDDAVDVESEVVERAPWDDDGDDGGGFGF